MIQTMPLEPDRRRAAPGQLACLAALVVLSLFSGACSSGFVPLRDAAAASDVVATGSDAGPRDLVVASLNLATDAQLDLPMASCTTGVASGTLALTLDPTLDTFGDPVLLGSLSTVELVDPTGAVRATATLSGQTAIVSLAGQCAGDYFLRVNGLAQALVPTRISASSDQVEQRVGTQLDASQIGPVGAPLYRIKTYSDPVVGFTSGVSAEGVFPYVLVQLSQPLIEIRVLGTASLLSSYVPRPVHPNLDTPFDSWLLNTDGQPHHGDSFVATGGAAACLDCHGNATTRPATYPLVSITNGWCYKCHAGSGGDTSDFVDPTR